MVYPMYPLNAIVGEYAKFCTYEHHMRSRRGHSEVEGNLC